MEEVIIRVFANQGAWALLFIMLLFYVLKENSKREENYQAIIASLTDKFDLLNDIQSNIQSIKETVQKSVKSHQSDDKAL